jgi:hypothetical protein
MQLQAPAMSDSSDSESAHCSDDAASKPGPRIALLTPYNGGNLGDAAIQDAMIANLRLRLPGAQFSGISLNCESFEERHHAGSFPIRGTSMWHGVARSQATPLAEGQGSLADGAGQSRVSLKTVLKAVPVLGWCLKTIHGWGREVRHWFRAYRFLRTFSSYPGAANCAIAGADLGTIRSHFLNGQFWHGSLRFLTSSSAWAPVTILP